MGEIEVSYYFRNKTGRSPRVENTATSLSPSLYLLYHFQLCVPSFVDKSIRGQSTQLLLSVFTTSGRHEGQSVCNISPHRWCSGCEDCRKCRIFNEQFTNLARSHLALGRSDSNSLQ